MPPEVKKPYPNDALIIVASVAGTECRAKMEGVHDCTCRDCDTALRADTATVRRAEDHPLRRGRPLAFLCRECNSRYGPPDVIQRDDLLFLRGLVCPCPKCGRWLRVGVLELEARRSDPAGDPIVVHQCGSCGCRARLVGILLVELTPADLLRLDVGGTDVDDLGRRGLEVSRALGGADVILPGGRFDGDPFQTPAPSGYQRSDKGGGGGAGPVPL